MSSAARSVTPTTSVIHLTMPQSSAARKFVGPPSVCHWSAFHMMRPGSVANAFWIAEPDGLPESFWRLLDGAPVVDHRREVTMQSRLDRPKRDKAHDCKADEDADPAAHWPVVAPPAAGQSSMAPTRRPLLRPLEALPSALEHAIGATPGAGGCRGLRVPKLPRNAPPWRVRRSPARPARSPGGHGLRRRRPLPSEKSPPGAGQAARRGACARVRHLLVDGELVAKSPAVSGLPPFARGELLVRQLAPGS